MRIQTEYMSFNNRWMISSSYDFQAHQQRSQQDVVFPTPLWCDLRCFQTCCRRSPVLPGAHKVLTSAPRCSQTYPNHCHSTPVPVIRDLSYSEGRPECPRMVWYCPEIDASKFALHIHSDTPGGFQWLKYLLLMADSLSIATMMSCILQTSMLVLHTQGNEVAWFSASDCFRSSQPSMHRWQDNIAASDCPHEA